MNHAEIQDTIPLLALGGLSQAEVAQLEAHLTVCPSCRALLAEYQFVSEELDAQTPVQTLPPLLEQKLMRRISASPAQPAAKPSFWRRQIPVARWAMALGGIVVLLLGIGAGALLWQLQRTGSATPADVAQLFTSPDAKIIQLTAGTGATTPAQGYIYLTPENKKAILWLDDMPPIDYAHAYQIWLVHGDDRDNGGLFRAGTDGRAVVLIDAPRPLSDYTRIGITMEPAKGSPGPTTPRVIGGNLE